MIANEKTIVVTGASTGIGVIDRPILYQAWLADVARESRPILTSHRRPVFTTCRRPLFTKRSCSVMRLWHHSSDPTSGLEENHQYYGATTYELLT